MSESKEQNAAANVDIHSRIKGALDELKTTFVAFFKSPRALWGINLPYVGEGLVYFGILTILGKFCSENVKLNDVFSGWVYGGVTSGITFAMLVLGGLSDRIGVRASLALSLGIMTLGRFFVSLSGTIPLKNGPFSPMFFMMAAGLLCMVTAYGLYQPSAYAGVKRYSNPRIASISYAVIYGLMNLGAFFSGFVSSFTRQSFKSVFPPNGLAAVFWVYTCLTVFGCLLTLIIITKKVDRDAVDKVALETARMRESGEIVEEKKEPEEKKPDVRVDNNPLIIYAILAFLSVCSLFLLKWEKTGPCNFSLHLGGIALAFPAYCLAVFCSVFFVLLSIAEYLRKRPDHPMRDKRFVFFIFILIPVQTLFAHNWLTIPYYLDRAFSGGWVSKYFEVFSNINPVLIFVLSPVVAALTSRAPIYRMMIIGTFVMALPAFLLTLGPNVFLFLTYVVLMSLGEAIWQPRFLQWIAEIAPEGKTGAYMGIGQFPWFLTKFITATYSGYFVARYCPKPGTGPLNTQVMWLIYSLIAILSPISLLLARRWMEKSMQKKI